MKYFFMQVINMKYSTVMWGKLNLYVERQKRLIYLKCYFISMKK